MKERIGHKEKEQFDKVESLHFERALVGH